MFDPASPDGPASSASPASSVSPASSASPASPATSATTPATTPAGDECGFTRRGCDSNRKVHVAALAATQFGRVRYDQLLGAAVAKDTIRRWRDDGYLHQLLPRVYAVGHPGRSTEADLAAAVLYAGPNALLSHATATWWLGLLRFPPDSVHVSTPREVQSVGNIVVHPRRTLERVMHNGLPVTTVAQALLDFAGSDRPDLLRLALASADYDGRLDVRALQNLTGRGIAGSAAIREALRIHLPQLAHTRSKMERLLLGLCERHRLPIPQCNVYLDGWLVDAHWPEHRLIVEVDGYRAHRTAAQLERDHQHDLALRAAGFIVLRYTWRQLTETPQAVVRDLRRHLG